MVNDIEAQRRQNATTGKTGDRRLPNVSSVNSSCLTGQIAAKA